MKRKVVHIHVTYKMGTNASVSTRSPMLPARNICASHYQGRQVNKKNEKLKKKKTLTLNGFCLYKIVTRGT